MAATDYSLITVGGPCKITDGAAVMHTEGNVQLEPQPSWRAIPSSLGGEQDSVLVDLTWKVSFTPKPIWDANTRGALLPDGYFNFTATGTRLIGAANRAVTILGVDGEQYALTRAIVTKPPELYLGLGKSLYSGVEYTAFLGQAKNLTDTDAFYTQSTGVAWTQADFPTGHQEALCSGAWGAVTGWTTVFAEEGFTLAHELKLEPVKQGNITVDYKVAGYRGMMGFKPQGPTSAQLLSAIALQGASKGIGVRQSTGANDMVVTGSGISVTLKKASVYKGQFMFDNKLNRHGAWAMITALTVPGTRLVFA